MNTKRLWAITLLTLLLLLPGFPLLLACSGVGRNMMGFEIVAFGAALVLHNLYYSLPRLIFGERMYPSEEFGIIPTQNGYVVAAILYTAIAIAISILIVTAIRQIGPLIRRNRKESKKILK